MTWQPEKERGNLQSYSSKPLDYPKLDTERGESDESEVGQDAGTDAGVLPGVVVSGFWVRGSEGSQIEESELSSLVS